MTSAYPLSWPPHIPRTKFPEKSKFATSLSVWDGLSVCFPVDRYKTVAANLQAIVHMVEADRTKIRHGSLAIVRAAMQGLQALPPAKSEQWWEVLGVAKTASTSEIEAAYRREAKAAHPDAGGTNERMAKVNKARAEATRERTAH